MLTNKIVIGILSVILLCSGSLMYIWNYRFVEGNNIGYEDGFFEGNSTGYVREFGLRYNEGYIEGKIIGNEEGVVSGLDSGYREGYDKGYSSGMTYGESSGYKNGFASGVSAWDLSLGYLEGFYDGGFSYRDPTYQEVYDFIKTDRTEDIGDYYYEDKLEQVSIFKKNANNMGYRCFWADVKFSNNYGIIIAAFNTTDSGMIYVDISDDRIVSVTVGKPYYDRNYYTVSWDDTVMDCELIP